MPKYSYDHIHLRTKDPKGMADYFHHMFDAETDPDALPAMVSKVSEWVIPKVL